MLENRIPPPLIGAAFALLMWLTAPYLPVLDLSQQTRGLLALALFLLGCAVAAAGVWSFRAARTTVNPLRPERASTLVVAGIYRFSRNPMYLGMALFLAAWAVWLRSPWTLLAVGAFMLYMNRFQIAPEERAMARLFGAQFTDYQSRVRRWI